MQDNDDNKIRNLIQQTIDLGICMDCEHSRCDSKQESLFRQAKALTTEARANERQAMLDALPEKKIKDTKDYINIGYNQAISDMETAIKKIGEK